MFDFVFVDSKQKDPSQTVPLYLRNTSRKYEQEHHHLASTVPEPQVTVPKTDDDLLSDEESEEHEEESTSEETSEDSSKQSFFLIFSLFLHLTFCTLESFRFKQSASHVTVNKKAAKWSGSSGAMALIDKEFSSGIYHVEFALKPGSGSTSWTPVVGIAPVPWSHSPTYSFGDSGSVAYYASGSIHLHGSTGGLASWSLTDTVGMEVDLRKKTPTSRTLVFFVNGKLQPVGVRNVSPTILFGVCVFLPQCFLILLSLDSGWFWSNWC